MPFAAESDELFSSATKTLLGPAFPEKAAAYLHKMQTLRNSKMSSVVSKQQSFQKAPRNTIGEGASLTISKDAIDLMPGAGKVKE